MRHAQYRLELADAVQAVTGLPVAAERSDGSTGPPSIAVQWVGSTLSRAMGWSHSYNVEVRVGERGAELDRLVGGVALAVAAFTPNTSHATAAPPACRAVTVIDGDMTYPAVVVSTVVNEPATD